MTQFTCKVSNRSITGYHLNTFTICISRRFSSAREFQMGNFQKYWSQNVGQDFIVLFYVGGGRAGGKGVCGRLMSPAHETQSMREIRLLRGRLPRKGGELTGMRTMYKCRQYMYNVHCTVHCTFYIPFVYVKPKFQFVNIRQNVLIEWINISLKEVN